MDKYVIKNWNIVIKFEIFLYEDGYFVFIFKDMKDRDEILLVGLYIINNKYVIFKFWFFDFNFYGEFFCVLFLWMKFYNFLFNCWGFILLSRIVSIIGKLIFVDECIIK